MHSFYKLACALVAWSALAHTAQAGQLNALASLPRDAFQRSTEHPDRFVFRAPDTQFGAYHGVLIEPLAFFGQDQGDWKLLVAAHDNPAEQGFRAQLIDVLQQHGVTVAHAPGAGILRLRCAVMASNAELPDDLHPFKAQFDLNHNAFNVNAYMDAITAIAQVEDALSGKPLAGSADFASATNLGPGAPFSMDALLHSTRLMAIDSGTRIARALLS